MVHFFGVHVVQMILNELNTSSEVGLVELVRYIPA